MQAVGPAPARHQPSCELINNDYLAVLENIINVPLEKGMRLKPLKHMMHQLYVGRVIQIACTEQFFSLYIAFICQDYGLCLFINCVVSIFLKPRHYLVYLIVLVRGFFRGP